MFKLQEMDREQRAAALQLMTLNNVIKASLVGEYPRIIHALGISGERAKTLLGKIWEDAGIIPKQTPEGPTPVVYPFFEPLPQGAFTGGALQEITDQICTITREKYGQVGAMLSYYQHKMAPVLTGRDNSDEPHYIICVSTQLDLYRALVAVHRSFGQDFKLPELPKNGISLDDPRRNTHLVPGGDAYDFYQRLIGNMSVDKPQLENLLAKENIDAAIVVYPYAQNGVRTSIFRRKSPDSTGEKFSYALLGYIMNMIIPSGITNKTRKVTSRIAKYDEHKKVGVQDISGIGFIDTTWPLEEIAAYIQASGVGTLFEARDLEYIPGTGEAHFDMEFNAYGGGTGFNGPGRTEFHGFSDIPHYVGAQLIGPRARVQWKQSRRTELKEAKYFGTDKNVEEAYDMIRDIVTHTLMCNIQLAYYPDQYYLYNPHNLGNIPVPRGMTLIPQIAAEGFTPSPLEGKYSLVNAFPWRPSRT